MIKAVKFDHWLPRFMNAHATAFGGTIYYRMTKEQAQRYPTLFRHELEHLYQEKRAGGMVPFLVTYFFQWVGSGFKYDKIPYELYAYGQQNNPLTAEELALWNQWIITPSIN